MDIRLIDRDKKRFLPLLLEADEQESMIDRYLSRGELFVLFDEKETPLAVAVVTKEEEGVHELKNLAVAAPFRRRGLGSIMVRFLIGRLRGGRVMLVGSGRRPAPPDF